MGEGLKIERKELDNDKLLLTLVGNITEDSQVDEISSNPKSTVVIDLEKVDRINSYGIRQWVNALKNLDEKVKELIFVKVPPAMVEQFNMISNFGAGGIVYSFFLPFYSESEDKERLLLYELPNGATPESFEGIVDQVADKAEGGKELVFNDIEDEYFYFLQYQKGKTVDPKLVDLIHQA